MIAIIEFKGKQFKVEPNNIIRTLQIEGEPGSSVVADRVLATIDGDTLNIGKPTLAGATVSLEILRHAKAPKIRIFKYKSKNKWSRRMGYREKISYLRVTSIGV
jgi:large subunit ribosomal protein L21